MSAERRTAWGTPVEHDHVITYRHAGRDEINVSCRCGVASKGHMPRERAEAFALEHRRAMGLLPGVPSA